MRAFIDEILSGDRVVYSFVSAWAIAAGVWVVLDWMSNPNRGRFRPKRDVVEGTFAQRRAARRRARAEHDAAVRATLRDAYGASSIRFTWDRRQESDILEADDALVRPSPYGTPPKPPPDVHLGELTEEPTGGIEPLLSTFDPDSEFVIRGARPQGRWKLGEDPRMLNRSGKVPSASTIRSRLWKNHSTDVVWGDTNQARMRSGKPAQRWNPLTGQTETATADPIAAAVAWRDSAVDPFEVAP